MKIQTVPCLCRCQHMGPLVFHLFGNRGLARLGLGGRGTGVGRKGGGDGGRGSRECRGRGEVGFIAVKGVARFVGAKPGDMVLSSTVETRVLFYASTALLGGQSWSNGTEIHGARVSAGGRGLERGDGCLGGRCTGRWVSFSHCLSCANAIFEALEVGGEFPVGFRDLVGKGKGIFDHIAKASGESGLLCGMVPLGVGHMA